MTQIKETLNYLFNIAHNWGTVDQVVKSAVFYRTNTLVEKGVPKQLCDSGFRHMLKDEFIFGVATDGGTMMLAEGELPEPRFHRGFYIDKLAPIFEAAEDFILKVCFRDAKPDATIEVDLAKPLASLNWEGKIATPQVSGRSKHDTGFMKAEAKHFSSLTEAELCDAIDELSARTEQVKAELQKRSEVKGLKSKIDADLRDLRQKEKRLDSESSAIGDLILENLNRRRELENAE